MANHHIRSLFFQLGMLVLLSGGSLHAAAQDLQTQNLSTRPQEQNRTITVLADFLYWVPSETVDWAFTLHGDARSVHSAYQVLSFDWDPGFRVGVGYNMDHDQWDTQFTYTWFQGEAHDHASGGVTSGFLATRLSLLQPFASGKIKVNLHYNMFDWDLGRSFSVSRYLSLRPFIGAKGGWINQQIHAKWESPIFLNLGAASEDARNDFRGGGPKGGLEGKWMLGNLNRHAFSLNGTFAGAYLWGNWTLRDRYVDPFGTHTSVPMGNRNFGALMFQALLGLGWDMNFDRNRSHFGMKVSYEIQDWLNHFQVFTNTSGTDNFDLILQGLTLDIRFDF